MNTENKKEDKEEQELYCTCTKPHLECPSRKHDNECKDEKICIHARVTRKEIL